MKRVLILGICLLIAKITNAQKSLLSLDEHNKYIYYQVVDLPAVSADSLHKNLIYFTETAYPKTKSVVASNSGAIIKDKFLTYTTLVKHENGEIAYSLNIECKDGKYRYWITDFVFTPYERNRYGVFVPSNGLDIPLETADSRLTKKELEGYFDQTGSFCKQLGEKLKIYMVEGRKIKKSDQQPVKKIVTDKW